MMFLKNGNFEYVFGSPEETQVKDGWEPHFVIIYKDVEKQLEMLGHMLGIEVVKY